MADTKTKLVCSIQASALLNATKDYNDSIACKSSQTTFNKFTNSAKEKLFKAPLNCYVHADKIGKSRVISGNDAEHILGHVKHIDNNHYIDFLRSIPLEELENISLDITIMPYENNDLIEELMNMMFLGNIVQSGSRSGKVDYSLLEKRFNKALPNKETISDYIERAQKFSYANYLNISTRSVSLNGGANNELK